MNGSLNRIFRVVWNVTLGVWQVASEHTRGKGKTKTTRLGGGGFSRLAAGSILVLCHAGALAELPTGGQITAGNGQIGTPSNGHLVVKQDSSKMAIDWNSFSVGQGNSVQFIQPSAEATALNRVLGGDPSIIRGTISANGRVVLLNPNGILFGPTSKVEVSSLLASTLNMSNEDFMAGNFRLEGDSLHSVVNQGSLRAADGGFVALVAAKIENVGDIRVRGGEVLMGAGRKVRLDLGGPARIEVDEAVVEGYIRNGGLIKAEGGRVVMTAKTAGALATLAINNEGIIEANSLTRGDGGTIQLLADGGTVTNSGTLNASAAEGKGGYVEVTGTRVGILDGSVIDASGATGGGTVLLGGDYQGKNAEVNNARMTYIAEQAVIRANALKNGNGGKVVAWADESTLYFGQIEAKGGAESGNGGFVEVSGKQYLDFQGQVDTSAAQGRNGTLLLDPTNLTIGNVATSGWISNQGNRFGDFTTDTDPNPAHDFSFLRIDVLLAALANNDITVLSACDVADCKGTITVKDAITWNSGKALTLDATGSIFINANIHSTGAPGVQGGAFNAIAATGNIEVNANITTAGGAATGGPGQAGGNVNLNAATGSVILGNNAVINSGGSAAAAGSNAAGGAAGTIALTSTTGVTLNDGDLLATGGAGDGSGAVGAGGHISLTSAAGAISQGAGSQIAGGDLVLTSTSGHISLNTGSNSVQRMAAKSDSGNIAFHNLGTAGLAVANIGGVNGVSTGGSANVHLRARNLQIDADVSSATGAITLDGNGSQTGDHSGVVLNGAQVTSQGGNIAMSGQGGNGANGNQSGVVLTQGALVRAGGAGTVSVIGTGGSGAGGGNQGVVVDGSSINSDGGAITVTATGGTAGDNNDAVAFKNSGQIGAATGNRAVTVKTQVGAGGASVAYRSDANGGHIGTGTGNLTLEGDKLSASGGTPGVNAPMAVLSTDNLTLRSLGTTFTDPFSLAEFAGNFNVNAAAGGLNDIGSLTIGKTGNTAAINIDKALSLAGKTVTLTGGDINLDKGLVAGTLNATASGNITQSEAEGSFTLGAANLSSGNNITLNGVTNSANALTATATNAITFNNGGNTLNLNGTLQANSVHLKAGALNQTGGAINARELEVSTTLGGVTLNQNNNVAALAVNANGGPLVFNNGGSSELLTLGTVGGTTGVRSTGAVTFNGVRDLEISESLSSGSSVTIHAGSRNIDLGSETTGKLSLTDGEIDRISAASLTLTTSGNVTNSADVRAGGISAMTISAGQGITNAGSGQLGFSHIDNGALTLSSSGTANDQGIGTSSRSLVTAGASELVLSSARDIHINARNRDNTAASNLDKLHITSTSGAASDSSFSVLSSGATLSLGRTTAPNWYQAEQQGVKGTYTLSLANTDTLDFSFSGNAPVRVNASSVGAANFAVQTTYGIDVAGNITGTSGNLSLKAGGSAGNYIGVKLNGREIVTANGSITIDGKGGTGRNTDEYSTTSNQIGVQILNGGSVRATGTGSVSIIGQGGSTQANYMSGIYGGNSDGVVITGVNSRVQTASGNIAISGTGGTGSYDSSATSDGIVLEGGGAITSASGSVKLTASATSGINGTNAQAITQSGAGIITATGLEVVSSSGWVHLTNNNNVGTLAGDVRGGFAFDNGGNNLIIGTVNGRAGFSETSSSELGLYDIGTLTVNESIEMTSGTLKIAADAVNIADDKRIGDKAANSSRNVNVWMTGKAQIGSTAARSIILGGAGSGALAIDSALLNKVHARNLELATTGTTTIAGDTEFRNVDQLALTSNGAIVSTPSSYLILSGANNRGTATFTSSASSVGSTGEAIRVRGADKINVTSAAAFNVEAYTRDSTTDLIDLSAVNITSNSGGAAHTYRIEGGGFNYSTAGNGSGYNVNANATRVVSGTGTPEDPYVYAPVDFTFTGSAGISINANSDLKGGKFDVRSTTGAITVLNNVAISSGSASLRAAGNITLSPNASLNAKGNVSFWSEGTGNRLATGTGSSIASTGKVDIRADEVVLDGTLTTPGTVEVNQVTQSRAIQIGGVSEGSGLSLTAAELGRITADTLIVGRNNSTDPTSGNISIAGADLTSISNLLLRSRTGSVSQSGALGVNSLDISLNRGDISLNNSGNTIRNFKAATDGAVALNNSGALEVKGITSTGKAIAVSTTGHLLTTGAILASASGTGVNAGGGAVTLTSTGGNLTVRSNVTSDGYSSASNSQQQGGAITLAGRNVEIGAATLSSRGSSNSGNGAVGGNAGSINIDATDPGGTITLDNTTINLTGGSGGSGAGSGSGAGRAFTVTDAIVLAPLAGGSTPGTVTINAGGGAVSLASVNGGADVANHLTISSVRAGTTPSFGNVTIGAIGASNAIGKLTLNNVGNVTLQDAKAAGIAITNNATTSSGITTINGNLRTHGVDAGGINIASKSIVLGSGKGYTTENGGNIKLATQGSLNLSDTLAFNSSGNIDLTADGGITLSGAGLQTQGAGVIFRSATTLASDMSVDTTGGGTVGTGGNVEFHGTLNSGGGARDLTITAGTTGDVIFAGQVGNTAQLDALTIHSANNVATSNSLRATSFTQNAGNGTTTLGGTTTLDGAFGFTGKLLTVNNALTAASATVNNAAQFTTSAAGDITVAGGFTQSGAGKSVLAGDISTTHANIRFAAPVEIAGTMKLDTGSGAGDITFAGALDSNVANDFSTLTLNAGSGGISFGGDIGVNRAVGNLVLNSGADVTLPGSVNARSLATDAAGSTILQQGARITTSGAQTYNDAVRLAGNAVVASTGSGNITFAGTVNGAHDLAVNTIGATTFGAAVGGTTALGSLSTDAGGSVTFHGDVSTARSQNYGENVTLGANVAFTSNEGSDITFGGTVNGAHQLAVHTAGTTTFSGAVGNGAALASINVGSQAGKLLLNGGSFKTSGAQTYGSGTIILGGHTVLQSIDAGAITLGGNVDAAICTVASLDVLTQGGTVFGGAIGTYRPLWSVTTDGTPSASNTVTFGQGTVITLGDQTYGETAILGANTRLTSLGQGNITFNGPVRAAVDGQQSLTVDTSGDIVFNGAVGDQGQRLASFDAGQSTDGAVRINGGGITTAGTQVYRQQVDLGNAAILTGTTGTFSTGIRGNGRDLTLRFSGQTDLEGAKITGVQNLVSDGSGVTRVSGTVATSGTQSYANDVVLASDTVLQSTGTGAGGNITLAGKVDGAHNLAINTAGTTSLAGTVGSSAALASLTTDGPGLTTIGGGGVRTTGSQTYGDAVQVTANAVLNSAAGGDVNFKGTVDGPGALEVQTAGVTRFEASVGGTTALASLATDAGGRVEINSGSVRTAGAQSYGDAVLLGADTTLSSTHGGLIGFGGTLDGSHHLAVNTNGTTHFGGVVGGTTALASLATDAGGRVVVNSGGITTTGNQTYGDAVEVTANAVLASTGKGDILFRETLDGPASLAINTAGATTFEKQVGGATALSSLSTDAGGQVVINGPGVKTTGGQSYGDAVTLGADVMLASTTDGDIVFARTVDGAHELTVHTGGTTRFDDVVGGHTALTGLVTGGTGHVSIGGGSIHTTGQQTYNNAVVLAANTTLHSSNKGDISFHRTVDGAQALSIDTAGSTTFNGAVGGKTALASLTTGADSETLINGGSVQTSGAQTFNGGVTVGAHTVFSSNGPVNFAGELDGPWDVTVRTPGVTTFGGAIGSKAPLANLYGGTGAGTIDILGSSIALTGSLVFEEAVHVRGATTVKVGGDALFYGDAKTGKSLLNVTAGGRIQYGRPVDNIKNYLPTLFSMGGQQASARPDLPQAQQTAALGLPGNESSSPSLVGNLQRVDLTSTVSSGELGTREGSEQSVNQTVNQIATDEGSRSTTYVVTVNGGIREAEDRLEQAN
jgi:filamentous hemagglutinin family protein